MSNDSSPTDGVEGEMIYDADGKLTDIKLPEHLRPDIDLEAAWYYEMMRDIRSSVVEVLSARSQPSQLTEAEIDTITDMVYAEACYLNLSDLERSGPKGGRRRDIGAEIAARAAMDIADAFGLPGRGIWEDSVSADLLHLIESVAREHKGHKRPESFKRRHRLKQGEKWSITKMDKQAQTEIMRIYLSKHGSDEFLRLLEESKIEYQRVFPPMGVVVGWADTTIEVIGTLAVIAGGGAGIAAIIVQWLKGKGSRVLQITLSSGDVVRVEGHSVEEVKALLAEARSVAAIQTQADRSIVTESDSDEL